MPTTRSIVVLRAEKAPADQLAFRYVQLVPARAMMVYQIRANLPGNGEVDVLAAPDVGEGLRRLDCEQEDFAGNASFSMGAAFLAPFVNRIRGRFLPDVREIETRIAGSMVRLPANGGGKAPGAERYALHGLILDRAAELTEQCSIQGGEAAKARLDAGDFAGRWLSTLLFEFEIQITSVAFSVLVRAVNTGPVPTPVGIGWHPYFRIPSGDRVQARVRLPVRARLLVNNYDEVLPTGEIVGVTGTPYDFNIQSGRALDRLYLDDCFVDLAKNADQSIVCEVVDPATAFGLRIISSSAEVTALQTYAPPDKPVVVIEPQFSWADPYGDVWEPGTNTGMITLQPGSSVEYCVRLELFRP